MSTLMLPAGIARHRLDEALCVAERIAGKDRSNLYVVSQFFEDRARYEAFIAMYAVMRLIDDRVDHVEDKTLLTDADRSALVAELNDWERRIKDAYDGRPGDELVDIALASAVDTFPVPFQLWARFIEAMRFDVDKPRFDDFEEFLAYGEGATVAPTSIYVYLLASQRGADERYRVERLDFIACGRDLGLFAYIAHVLRDVCEDLAVGRTGLVYLSTADLRLHRLSEGDLRSLAAGTATDDVHASWRALVRDICGRAAVMRARGTTLAAAEWDRLPSDCSFIFRLIVDTYAELLDRIATDPGCVWRRQSVLTDQDKFALLQSAATASGYQPQLHA